MTFIFNNTIPAAANDPSVDQSDMLANNVATDGILAVDHIGFNAANGGTHLQVHLPIYTNPAVINGSATEGSVVFGAAGVADIAHAQLKFKQPNGTFPLSTVRAYGFINGTTGAINASQSFNVSSVVKNSTGFFTVTLVANVTTGTNFGVLVSNSVTVPGGGQAVSTYTITGAAVFEIFCTGLNEVAKDTTSITFIVIQI